MTDDKVKTLLSLGYAVWENNPPSCQNVTYVWANKQAVLGVGRCHTGNIDNNRVNPTLTIDKILSIKDAGKTFCSAFVSKITSEDLKLFYKEDTSEMLSKNASKDEIKIKKLLVGNKFINYRGKNYKKVEFMDEIVTKCVEEYFGLNSTEHVLTVLASGDGDLWSRFSRHKKSKEAVVNILKKVTNL